MITLRQIEFFMYPVRSTVICVCLNAFLCIFVSCANHNELKHKRITIGSLDGEKWYGAVMMDGDKQPFTDFPMFDLANQCHDGQTASLLVSSKGRYIWSEKPFAFSFINGDIHLDNLSERISPVSAGNTLREAYLAAAREHLPFDGTTPPEEFFTKPQFNNWVESAVLGINQKNAEDYVSAIARNGFPCGILMIDGGWMVQHGVFRFNPETFPNPDRLFELIHTEGYKSMVWVSYFLSADCREGYLDYRLHYPRKKPLLVESTEYPGEECIVHWWSGKSVTLDLTNPEAFEEFVSILQSFKERYHIYGFKFDGGNPEYFRGKAKFYKAEMEPCDFSHAYNLVGLRFPYHEFRAGYNMGGYPVIVRLQDVEHSWKGLENMIYDVLTGGIMGYPYVIGDMIGGGQAGNFAPGGYFSPKLVVRSCQAQALMPMMQFSVAPWRALSENECNICRDFAQLHVRFGPYIMEQVRHASQTGEPIVRMMEYEFPGQGFDRRMTQFMLGPKYLVAPVVNENDSVTVELPEGRWKDDLGVIHSGPAVLQLNDVPIERLPYYERID